jgi:hypothetical protein
VRARGEYDIGVSTSRERWSLSMLAGDGARRVVRREAVAGLGSRPGVLPAEYSRGHITMRNWRANTLPGMGAYAPIGLPEREPKGGERKAAIIRTRWKDVGRSCRGQQWTAQVKLADPAAPVASVSVTV